jgi:hypothetical protein
MRLFKYILSMKLGTIAILQKLDFLKDNGIYCRAGRTIQVLRQISLMNAYRPDHRLQRGQNLFLN